MLHELLVLYFPQLCLVDVPPVIHDLVDHVEKRIQGERFDGSNAAFVIPSGAGATSIVNALFIIVGHVLRRPVAIYVDTNGRCHERLKQLRYELEYRGLDGAVYRVAFAPKIINNAEGPSRLTFIDSHPVDELPMSVVTVVSVSTTL